MSKKVIYTAIFGGKDNLQEPNYVPKGWDFICFTDSDFSSKIWEIRKVKLPLPNDPVRSARKYKILPHKFLPSYDYSIWIDGNLVVRGDVNELVDKYLGNYNFGVFNHTETEKDKMDCIYQQARELIWKYHRGKNTDKPRIIRKQIRRYRKEGYPKNNGLIISMIILRRHNEPDVIKTMGDWWQEVKNFSRRDQLSFNYVAWKNKLNFVYIKGDSRDNKYFKHTPHKKPAQRFVSPVTIMFKILSRLKSLLKRICLKFQL